MIRALSASQAERFDPEQVGGCKRRWYFQDIMRLEVPEPEESKQDGHAGHALFAMHYRGEPLPKRHRMLKGVRSAIAKGELPAREPGQLIESRFDGTAPSVRSPLDIAHTLWLGGVPWDGYVDLRFYREGTITVLDHKFSSDIHTYAKPADQLLATVQMPVYALDSLRLWPEARHVELVHHYVSRRGVDSFLRRQLVTVEQVRQRGWEIERLVREMIAVSQAKSPEEVPGNRASCHTWSGCPFQSRCTAFKEKPKMELNPEEQEWLSALGGGETKPTGNGLAEALKVLDSAEPVVLAAAVDGLTETEKAKLADFVKGPVPGPEADRVTEMEIASAGGALTPEDDPFAVFAPKSSIPAEQSARPPSCGDCGAELSTENGSQRDGVWTHVGCPAGVKIGGPVSPNVTVVRGSGEGASTLSPKCPDCPHSAHAGQPCSGKRGRGACRCGAQGAVTLIAPPEGFVGTAAKPEIGQVRELPSHLPTCVQNDGGKWLCMEGCSAASTASGTVDLNAPAELILTCDKCGERATFLGIHRWKDAEKAGWRVPVRGQPGNVWCNAHAPTFSGVSDTTGQALSPSDNGVVKPTGFVSDSVEDPAWTRIHGDLARERDMHRRTLGELDASERERNRLKTELDMRRAADAGAPIPMLLWCPTCHARHIDEGEFANKPHHTHACQSCGLAWRPAVVTTMGVKFLPGFKND